MNIEKLKFDGIDENEPVVIAGPCSAESREQVLSTATELAKNGIKIFRAGIWKPRTKPGSFQGVGTEGLAWLREVKEMTGMKVATEVATAEHVEEAVKAGVDILWIGARTVTNPFAMQELAELLKDAGCPVLVKNPVNPDLELWIGAIERLYKAGVGKIGAVHRGFSQFEKKLYRNEPIWQIPIELKRRYPELTLICDPSHIGGKRELIQTISQQAFDLKYDGLMIETHCNPDNALSDSEQQVTPERLKEILDKLKIRDNEGSSEYIYYLRQQIDEIDNNLLMMLTNRMNVSRSLGRYKKEHNMPILQSDRYNMILQDRTKTGEELHLRKEFVEEIVKLLHEESVRVQLEDNK